MMAFLFTFHTAMVRSARNRRWAKEAEMTPLETAQKYFDAWNRHDPPDSSPPVAGSE